MIADFETSANTSGSSDVPLEMWRDFWTRVYFDSLKFTDERTAQGSEDFNSIFHNSIYVVEILMNLMVYYSTNALKE